MAIELVDCNFLTRLYHSRGGLPKLLYSTKWRLHAGLEKSEPFVEFLVELVIKQLLLVDHYIHVLNISTLLLPVDRIVL